MLSAIDCTWLELTGSGRVAIAACIAEVMMLIISGENDAFEKSFMCCRPQRLPATQRGGIARNVSDTTGAQVYSLLELISRYQ
jgi:hypothetical protein